MCLLVSAWWYYFFYFSIISSISKRVRCFNSLSILINSLKGSLGRYYCVWLHIRPKLLVPYIRLMLHNYVVILLVKWQNYYSVMKPYLQWRPHCLSMFHPCPFLNCQNCLQNCLDHILYICVYNYHLWITFIRTVTCATMTFKYKTKPCKISQWSRGY